MTAGASAAAESKAVCGVCDCSWRTQGHRQGTFHMAVPWPLPSGNLCSLQHRYSQDRLHLFFLETRTRRLKLHDTQVHEDTRGLNLMLLTQMPPDYS